MVMVVAKDVVTLLRLIEVVSLEFIDHFHIVLGKVSLLFCINNIHHEEALEVL